MKNLLYISCHNTMECNELEMLSKLDFSCVTIGNFTKGTLVSKSADQPEWSLHDWRSPIYNRNDALTNEFISMNPNFTGMTLDKYNFTKEYLNKFDVIFVSNNWPHMKSLVKLGVPNSRQLFVWCSVGQTNKIVEQAMRQNQIDCKNKMVIVRCCPSESEVIDFCGVDYYIISHVDHSFNVDWIGDKKQVITVTRGIKKKSRISNYEIIQDIMSEFPHKIYGKGNEDLPVELNGGELSFPDLIKTYQQNRVFICGGSSPAPITYTFAEAMTVGIPVVCLGPKLVRTISGPKNLFYMDKYIQNGVNGFVSDSVSDLKKYCRMLLEDYDMAKEISKNASKFARENWSFPAAKIKWEKLFKEKLPKFIKHI